MVLTLDSINGDLWLPTVSVSGHVSDPTAAIWVNGVQGTNNGDGTWSATNVPVTPGGVASFDMNAVPAGGNDPYASVNQNKNTGVVMDSARGNYDDWADALTLHFSGNWNWSRQSGGYKHTRFEPGTDWNETDDTIAPDLTILNRHITGSDGTDTNIANNGTEAFDKTIGSWSGATYLPELNGTFLLWSKGSGSERVNMVLLTGGKSGVNKQGIMALTTSATDDTTLQAIPNNQITVAGRTLGSDGWVYGTVEIGGDPVDVTPQTGVPLYSFSGPDGGVYIPYITANGHNLDNETPEFCVGQQVNFQVNGLPSAQTPFYNWHFSTKYYNHSSRPNWHSSLNWDVDSGIFTAAEPYAYWVSDGNKNASSQVTLHFSNGQTTTVTAKGQFNVYRPTVSIVRKYDYGAPTVIWNPAWTMQYAVLQVGTGVNHPNSMNFYGGVQSKYGGNAKWVQIVSVDMTGDAYFDGVLVHDPVLTSVLDNQDPFEGDNWRISPNATPSGSLNTVPLDDSPAATVGQNLLNGIRFNIDCTDYLMFNPDPYGSGIWVTLGKTTTPWSVHCHASWPSLDILPDEHVTGPGDLDNSTGFPQWSDILSNP
jgi:hypothetical protein